MPEDNKGNDQSATPVAGSQSPVASEKSGETEATADSVVSHQSAVVSKSGEGDAKQATSEAAPKAENVEKAASPATPKPTAPAAEKPAAPAEKPATPAMPGTPAAKPAVPAAAGAAKPAAPAAAKPAVPPKPEGPKPEPWNSPMAAFLKKTYGSGVKEASTYVGQNYLVVDKSIVHEVLSILREEEQFDYCVDVTAVHYPKKDEQFEVIYVLYSFPHNQRLRVKTAIKDGERIATATDIWPAANWLEREVFDMFGIEFEGHPDPRRILLPEDWKGHPLRKDHDILKQDTEWVHIHLGIESGQ
jgi:NADH-quinone oxidoreductase subunit C